MTIDPLQVEYPIVVRPDLDTNGERCWVAEHPDLPGCAAHGTGQFPISEAKALLSRARIAYIQYLLDHDLTVPMPSPHRPAEGQMWQMPADRAQVASPPVVETPNNPETHSITVT
jgi:predicted RNase H-like HicB family nuclease